MRRLALTGFTTVLLVASSPSVFAAPLNVRDVPAGDADRAAIEFLNAHDVIYGSPDGTFRPDANITRGEILKIALEASGEGRSAFVTTKTGAGRYSDVPEAHTLSSYIAYASDQAYINGYPDGTFHPDAEVTRAEAAKIMARILHAPGSKQPSPYTDLGGSSLAPFIHDVYGANWYRPTPPQFNPNIPVTRREVARMAYRALVASGGQPADSAPPYDETLVVPNTLAADWQTSSENGVQMVYPAGWVVENQQGSEQGATIAVSAVGPTESSTVPAFALFVIDVPDVNAFRQQEDSSGQYTDPVLRAFAVGPADSQHFAAAFEFHETTQGLRIDAWPANGKLYAAAYFERDYPGLGGTFDRFVQHALELDAPQSPS